jgi:hypothetical protein
MWANSPPEAADAETAWPLTCGFVHKFAVAA